MYAGAVAGDVGETIGIALAGLGVFVGWKFGPRAEKKFNRALFLVTVGGLVLCVLLVLTWWTFAS
jgi:hypothetical protein